MTPLLCALAVLLSAGALAADAAWMATGVESRPDLTGRPQLRMEQQLGTHLRLNERWSLDGQGALRDPAAPDAPLTGDLLALSATRQGPQSTLRAGRQVRVDPRGALHLDGVSLEWPRDDQALALWSGRLWHPETWRPGSTWAGGLGLDHRLAPGRDLSLGAEARLAPQGAQTRVFGAFGLRGARGQAGRALAELALGRNPGSRLQLGGDLPLSGSNLGADLRWEDLPEDLLPAALRSPMAWLAPQGYGAAAVRGSRRLGPWRLSAEGGPTLHRQQPGVETGGIGRLAVGLNGGRGPDLGLALVGARRGPAALVGAVVESGLGGEGPRLNADLGCYRLQASTGPGATVWEARLRAGAPLGSAAPQHKLLLRAEVAGGVDRLLQPFVRGGAVLEGRFGAAGGRG